MIEKSRFTTVQKLPSTSGVLLRTNKNFGDLSYFFYIFLPVRAARTWMLDLCSHQKIHRRSMYLTLDHTLLPRRIKNVVINKASK